MKSVAEFPTNTRLHIGLGVENVEASTAFYRELLGMAPVKTRPGYAKFESIDPAVNLSLNQVQGDTRSANPGSHFGIQVKSTEAVSEAADRLRLAGVEVRMEEQTTCCYAVQDKAWVDDPDGNSWEFFVVTQADTPEFKKRADDGSGCCTTNSQEACC